MRDMPTWLKLAGATYFAGLLGVAYIVGHFVAKFW